MITSCHQAGNILSIGCTTVPREGLATCSLLSLAEVESVNPLWTPLFAVEVGWHDAMKPQLWDDLIAEAQRSATDISSNNESQLHLLSSSSSTAEAAASIRTRLFWWNRYTHDICADPPDAPKPCRGGLLADEMVSYTPLYLYAYIFSMIIRLMFLGYGENCDDAWSNRFRSTTTAATNAAIFHLFY